MEDKYILQDVFDRRLYFKGIDANTSCRAFTANEDNATIYNKQDARLLALSYNLTIIKV